MDGSLFTSNINPLRYVNGKEMKVNTSNSLDQYFTSKKMAKRLFDKSYEIIKSYEGDKILNYTWVEPSAGDGSFYNCFPNNKVGIDISPLNDKFVKCDYLNYELPKNTIVMGNPPFGHRGIVALNFINHSHNADYVCFILPMFFESRGKGSIKYRVKHFNLIYSEKLPNDAFYSYTTKKIVNVKCVFQIWSKNHQISNDEYSWYNNKQQDPFGDILKVVTVSLAKNRECGKHYIFDERADFYISSTFHDKVTIGDSFDDVKYKSGIAVVFTTKNEDIKNRLKLIFQQVDWKKYATLATNSCYHIGKSNVFQIVHDNLTLLYDCYEK